MKLPALVVCLFLFGSGFASSQELFPFQQVPVSGVSPVDPQATATTKRILQYLYNISGNHTLSGQYLRGNDWWTPFQTNPESVATACQAIPAVMGFDPYFDDSTLSTAVDVPNAITQWNSGGLVLMMMTLFGLNGPTGATLTPTDAVNITTPGTALYTTWHNQVDKYVNLALIPLNNAGATVLYRPLPEMNGNWAWYWTGSVGDAGYAAIWQDLFTYLTGHWGLHNLLWVWSPNGGVGGYTTGYRSPYVDIVALDWYTDGGPSFPDGYNQLTATGKPFMVGEAGYSSQVGYDWSQWPNLIQSQMPLTTAVLGWMNDYLTPPRGINCAQMMANPQMINLGGVHS